MNKLPKLPKLSKLPIILSSLIPVVYLGAQAQAHAQAIIPQPQIQQLTNEFITCLCWDKGIESDVTSSVIYSGTNIGQYTMSTTNLGNTGRACVTNMVIPNVTNYISITAMNDIGLESDFSNPVWSYFTQRPLEVLDSIYEPGRITLRYIVDDGQKPHIAIKPSMDSPWYYSRVGVSSSIPLGNGRNEEVATMPLPNYEITPTILYLKHNYAYPVGDCGVLKPQTNFKKL